MRRSRRPWLAVMLAAGAVAFMAAMTWYGRAPESRWLVKPVVAGVLPVAPDHITQVEVTAPGRRLVLVRGAAGWSAGHGPLSSVLAAHLEEGLKFLHAAAPVRVIGADEYRGADLGDYGLVPPRYTVVLFAGGQRVLEAGFGAPNPQQVLQYVRLGGHEEIHLMPRFLGQEWERVIAAADT